MSDPGKPLDRAGAHCYAQGETPRDGARVAGRDRICGTKSPWRHCWPVSHSQDAVVGCRSAAASLIRFRIPSQAMIRTTPAWSSTTVPATSFPDSPIPRAKFRAGSKNHSARLRSQPESLPSQHDRMGGISLCNAELSPAPCLDYWCLAAVVRRAPSASSPGPRVALSRVRSSAMRRWPEPRSVAPSARCAEAGAADHDLNRRDPGSSRCGIPMPEFFPGVHYPREMPCSQRS